MPKTFAKLQFCVYVLHSVADDFLYAGFSTNMKQRLTDHFNGRNQATAPHAVQRERVRTTTLPEGSE